MGRLPTALLVVLAVCTGCYSPRPSTGAPCGPDLPCPKGQRCDELAAICMLPNQAPGTEVDAPESSADPEAGIDPDADPGPDAALPPPPDAPIIPGPPNDRPDGAIDVSAGGTFTWDPTYAVDDFASPCASAAGPDVFFTITLAAPEVIYLDTFGSTANAVIAVRAGDCSPVGAAEACVDDSCGGMQAQGAWNLGTGTHCIVVDQVGTNGGTMGRLLVKRGNRAGNPLSGTSGSVMGNTCNDDNSNSAGCGDEPADDTHYFFTACPGTTPVSFETCNGANWDTVLQVRDGVNASLGCDDDSCSVQSRITRNLTGPDLFWVVVDGYGECGAYTMQYTLQ